MVQLNRSLSGQASVTDALVREVTARLTGGSGQETFIDNYLASIRKAIRSSRNVADSFAYVVERSIVPLPSLLAQDLETTDRLYQQRAIRDAEVQAELEAIEQERRIAREKGWTQEQQAREERDIQLQLERERMELQKIWNGILLTKPERRRKSS